VGAAVAHRPVTVDGSARVTILEKEDGLAQHQTRRKAGISIEEVRAQTEKAIPLGRYGTAEEFGTVAAFLVSAANTYLAGQHFLVDGGMVRAPADRR
jgi:NAD(P)-dependent dehydrogenase (short-subunit alcohol dehydrogenase family)